MIAKKLPAITANNPNNLFFAFLETTSGAAIKVPKKTLKIWINSKIVILMNIQNMFISMNIGAL